MECILCCEKSLFMTVGVCEHKVVCLKCSLKLRSINKNLKCVYCNTLLKDVAVIDSPEKNFFDVFDKMQEFKFGIYSTDGRTKGACFYLLKIKCPIKNCKDKRFYNNKISYKKHLQNIHRRFLCDLCVDNSTLLLDEHKIYRENEFCKHLENGDFDTEKNLVNLHPKCCFCHEHFFDDEAFYKHCKQKHEKCFLCKKKKFKDFYYKNYQSLEIHFGMSHYACSDLNCKAKGFVVFKTKEELEKHMVIIHKAPGKKKIRVLGVGKVDEEIYDDEGVDLSLRTLAYKKKEFLENDIDLDRKNYKNEFDILAIFEHFIDFKSMSIEQERDIIFQMKKKHKFSNDVFLEGIKFEVLNSHTTTNFQDFLEKAKMIIDQNCVKLIKNKTGDYLNYKIKEKELFAEFKKIFGPKLVYKYFYLYYKTVKNTKTYQKLEEYFYITLDELYFKNPNCIVNVHTWKNFFEIIVKKISVNILERISQKKIKINKMYKLASERLFQLIGLVRKIQLAESIKFRYVSNFLIKREALEFIEKMLTVHKNKTQQVLNNIGNIDIFVIFMYFNLITLRFEDKEIKNRNKINPNMLKLFLRHFPEIAKKNRYDLESDEEDYDDNHKDNIKTTEVYKKEDFHHIKKSEKKTDYSKLKINQVFENKEGHNYDENSKFDFPELSKKTTKSSKKEEEESEIEYNRSGWNGEIQIMYENKKTKEKEMKKEFPTLGDFEEKTENKNIFKRVNLKKTKSNNLKNQFGYNNDKNKNFAIQDDSKGRNLFSELGGRGGDIGFIVKKKKKKKKKW